jgi:DNA topoisomerase-1
MNVLIVESAAKARTLKKYLEGDWTVVATGGHVETLPDDRKRHGKDARKAYWANRSGELPSPPWVWTDRGEAAVEAIVEEAGADPEFWIATDPDREGEFIAWCLDRLLEPHGPTHRVTFQEVTEEAVHAALENPRGVDRRMVESALVRKFLDRLVGFRTSKMARSMVPGRGASMGRVQTPTLGFVVERELEREAHVPIPYFEVRGTAQGVDLQARFHEPGDEEVWRDEADRAYPTRTFDRELAEEAFAALEAAGRVTVTSVRSRKSSRKPSPPFSTDTLLQTAGSRFGWSPGKTSVLASQLYEAGHITYIRTDSTRLAESAVRRAREVVEEAFGEDHLGPTARGNVASGPVQDAHEAIRPTRIEQPEVETDDEDARKLYRLVRAQTLSSQMAPSTSTSLRITTECADFARPFTGSVTWRTFAGWEAAFAEFLDDRATSPPDIPLEEGAVWPLDEATEEDPNPELVEDETRPPSRYRPHTLIKTMKEAGIGRPSTYARTVEKLEERTYVEMEDGSLVPTERGRVVWTDAAPLYARDGNGEGEAEGIELFSPDFTADMESRLDELAGGGIPAPETWERWRDLVRELHEEARERKRRGDSTLRQQDQLARLLKNAPEPLPVEPDEIASLTWAEARAIIDELREAGVEPAPTRKQLDYIRSLAEDLELDDEEAAELIGRDHLTEVRTSSGASTLIEELKRLHDERRPASAAQRRFIESLLEETGVPEEEAAALVEVESLDELTGGREGSASALIDLLQARAQGEEATSE